jgi:hypothetical protein
VYNIKFARFEFLLSAPEIYNKLQSDWSTSRPTFEHGTSKMESGSLKTRTTGFYNVLGLFNDAFSTSSSVRVE